jgi:hypothetical protein
MEKYITGRPDHRASNLEWLGTAYNFRLEQIPFDEFITSNSLLSEGWPDFTVKSLADWNSSITPSPSDPVDDCCLVAALPSISGLVGRQSGWRLIIHETGGIWQEPLRALVLRLTVNEHGRTIAQSIARHMAATNISARFASFDQLNEYRSLLNDVGLDCNENVRCLAEAFYPIDLAEEALTILGVTDFPFEVSEGVDIGSMFLAIMAPNCSEL